MALQLSEGVFFCAYHLFLDDKSELNDPNTTVFVPHDCSSFSHNVFKSSSCGWLARIRCIFADSSGKMVSSSPASLVVVWGSRSGLEFVRCCWLFLAPGAALAF